MNLATIGMVAFTAMTLCMIGYLCYIALKVVDASSERSARKKARKKEKKRLKALAAA